jgi:hypothetical protein
MVRRQILGALKANLRSTCHAAEIVTGLLLLPAVVVSSCLRLVLAGSCDRASADLLASPLTPRDSHHPH